MTIARQQLGQHGEDVACRALEERGHVIVDRRYRTEHGELDVVTRHNGFTVFVEVKTKTSGAFGEPSEAVHARKQQQLVWIATDYVARHGLEHTPCRFDVVSIESAFDPPLVTIIEDAFRPGW